MDTIKCQECGTIIALHAKFCHECGYKANASNSASDEIDSCIVVNDSSDKNDSEKNDSVIPYIMPLTILVNTATVLIYVRYSLKLIEHNGDRYYLYMATDGNYYKTMLIPIALYFLSFIGISKRSTINIIFTAIFYIAAFVIYSRYANFLGSLR